MKMHAVFICAEYPYKGRPTGGFGTYVNNLSHELVKIGTKITIICQGETPATVVDNGRKIIVVSSPLYSLSQKVKREPRGMLARLAAFIHYPLGFSVSAAHAIYKLQQRSEIQIIEGGDFGAETFVTQILRHLRMINTKIVIKLHTPSFMIRKFNDEELTLFYWVMEKLERWCLAQADRIYTPTEALRKIAQSEYDMSAFPVIPYAADNLLVGRPLRRMGRQILYVGKIQQKKGVEDFLAAAALLIKKFRNIQFMLVGPDTTRNGVSVTQMLKLQIAENQIDAQVKFIAPVAQKKLMHYYQASAVLVVPSHWENFPNVILEAGLYGMPVIATKVGGIMEMIKHRKTGLLVAPQSPRALANAIKYIIRHPAVAHALGKNLRMHISTAYSAKRVALLTHHFYAGLLQASTGE